MKLLRTILVAGLGVLNLALLARQGGEALWCALAAALFCGVVIWDQLEAIKIYRTILRQGQEYTATLVSCKERISRQNGVTYYPAVSMELHGQQQHFDLLGDFKSPVGEVGQPLQVRYLEGHPRPILPDETRFHDYKMRYITADAFMIMFFIVAICLKSAGVFQ